MRRIKIPLQDFALKMQGGAYARGGAYLRDTTVYGSFFFGVLGCNIYMLNGTHYQTVNSLSNIHIFNITKCLIGLLVRLSMVTLPFYMQLTKNAHYSCSASRTYYVTYSRQGFMRRCETLTKSCPCMIM